MSLYAQTVPQHIKMLQNLDRWLEAAVAYAETRKFDADTLLLARLAPDPRAGRAAVFGALIEVGSAEATYGASGPNAGRRSPRIGASEAANVAVRWWSSR